MQHQKLISICTPTYKRAETLIELLESIPESYRDKIEICISDNGPTDDTKARIEEIKYKFPYLKFEQRDKNYGFTNNLLHVVSMASGKYCWTVGSDDRLTENALDILFEIINKYEPAIIISNAIAHSSIENWTSEKKILSIRGNKFVFNFADKNKMKEYYDLSKSMNCIGGFISTNIFNRKLWLDSKINIDIADEFVHVNKISAMIFSNSDKNKKLIYLNKSLVHSTLDNDAVFYGDWTAKKRLFVDLRAVTEVADEYINDLEIKKKFINILTRQHPFHDLYRFAVMHDVNNDELKLLKRIFPFWQIFICRYFGYKRDGFIHKMLKFLKRKLPKGNFFLRKSISFIWRIIFYNTYVSIVDGKSYWGKTRIDFLALIKKPGDSVNFKYSNFLFYSPPEALYLISEMKINGYTDFIYNCCRVLDLGGYIGESAIFLSKKNKEVWSYEPDIDKFRLLKSNVSLNKLDSRIKTFNYAVVGNDRDKAFLDSRVAFDGTAKLSDKGVEVSCMSIKKVLRSVEFDALKMDIEGGEYEIFDYFINNPENFPFKCGVIELHLPASVNERSIILDKFLGYLKEKSFEFAFYKRSKRLMYFNSFSEIRSKVKSEWIMMKFNKK